MLGVSDINRLKKSNGATPEAEKSFKRKRTQKNIQKLLKISKNMKKKKHICLLKSSNILGESYVKPCAKSDGTTPNFENWFYEKICPKN